MDLADLIEPGRVVYAGRASNKEQLLQDLASRAATLLNLDAQTICNALQAREELGSTGLGDGFALRMLVSKDSTAFSACSRGWTGRSISTRSTESRSISCFSYSSRQPLAASISPRSLLSRGTCATRHSPLNCAKHQALPRCAAYFAIPSIRDLRAAVLQSDSTPVSRPITRSRVPRPVRNRAPWLERLEETCATTPGFLELATHHRESGSILVPATTADRVAFWRRLS